jgi:hypothetical protein
MQYWNMAMDNLVWIAGLCIGLMVVAALFTPHADKGTD